MQVLGLAVDRIEEGLAGELLRDRPIWTRDVLTRNPSSGFRLAAPESASPGRRAGIPAAAASSLTLSRERL